MSEEKRPSAVFSAIISIATAGGLTVAAFFLLFFAVCMPIGPMTVAGLKITTSVIVLGLLMLPVAWGALRAEAPGIRWGLIGGLIILVLIGVKLLLE